MLVTVSVRNLVFATCAVITKSAGDDTSRLHTTRLSTSRGLKRDKGSMDGLLITGGTN